MERAGSRGDHIWNPSLLNTPVCGLAPQRGATGREQSSVHAGAGAVRPPNRTVVDFCWALKPQEEPNKLLHGQIRPVVFKVLFNGLGILLKKKKNCFYPRFSRFFPYSSSPSPTRPLHCWEIVLRCLPPQVRSAALNFNSIPPWPMN